MPADIEAVRLSLSIYIGDVDFGLPMEGARQVQGVFEEKNNRMEGGRYEIVVLEGAKHGFAVRGNPNAKKKMEQGIVAEDQAVNWFRKWCVKSSVHVYVCREALAGVGAGVGLSMALNAKLLRTTRFDGQIQIN